MRPDLEAIVRRVEEPIDLSALLDRVREFIASYVIAIPEVHVVVTLWITHTHVFEAAEATPYLNITSPEKQSGKTLLMEVMHQLVHRPIRTANISDAALFRIIVDPEKGRATIMLDEVDAIWSPSKRVNPREDLRSLINAGNTRGTPAIRMEGEGTKMHPVEFDVFGPKVLTGIGKIPDTLEDRCIPIRMQRKLATERVQRFRRRDAKARAEPIRRALAEWAAGAVEALTEARPDEIPDELSDRQCDAWEPLLAIADAAGGAWPALARDAAVVLHGGERQQHSGGVEMLGFIGQAFDDAGTDRLTSKQLCGRLNSIEEAPYGGWGKSGIEPRELARKLKPYGIGPRPVNFPGQSTARGYHRGDFEEAWSRYLSPLSTPRTPPPDVTSVTPQVDGLFPDVTTPFDEAEVTYEKGPLTSNVTEITDNGEVEGGEAVVGDLPDDVCAAILDFIEAYEEKQGFRPGAIQVIENLRATRGGEYDIEAVISYLHELDPGEEEAG